MPKKKQSKKKNKLKEFFRPTTSKIILFILLVLLTYILFISHIECSSVTEGTWNYECRFDLKGDFNALLFIISGGMVAAVPGMILRSLEISSPFLLNLFFAIIIHAIYLFILSCVITALFGGIIRICRQIKDSPNKLLFLILFLLTILFYPHSSCIITTGIYSDFSCHYDVTILGVFKYGLEGLLYYEFMSPLFIFFIFIIPFVTLIIYKKFNQKLSKLVSRIKSDKFQKITIMAIIWILLMLLLFGIGALSDLYFPGMMFGD